MESLVPTSHEDCIVNAKHCSQSSPSSPTVCVTIENNRLRNLSKTLLSCTQIVSIILFSKSMPGFMNNNKWTKVQTIEDLFLKEQFIQHLQNLDTVQTLLVSRGIKMKRQKSHLSWSSVCWGRQLRNTPPLHRGVLREREREKQSNRNQRWFSSFWFRQLDGGSSNWDWENRKRRRLGRKIIRSALKMLRWKCLTGVHVEMSHSSLDI